MEVKDRKKERKKSGRIKEKRRRQGWGRIRKQTKGNKKRRLEESFFFLDSDCIVLCVCALEFVFLSCPFFFFRGVEVGSLPFTAQINQKYPTKEMGHVHDLLALLFLDSDCVVLCCVVLCCVVLCCVCVCALAFVLFPVLFLYFFVLLALLSGKRELRMIYRNLCPFCRENGQVDNKHDRLLAGW